MTDTHRDIGSAGHDIPLGRVVLYCLAILSIAAAVIHFAAAGDYFQSYWLFSLSMLVIAWLQATWAAVAVIRPSRGLLRAGAWLNAAVLTLYLVTQATGNGIGTAPHATGLSAFAAGLSAVLGTLLVLGSGWLLTARPSRRVPRQRLITMPAATGAMSAALLGLALTTAAPGTATATANTTAGTAGRSMPGMVMPGPAARRPARPAALAGAVGQSRRLRRAGRQRGAHHDVRDGHRRARLAGRRRPDTATLLAGHGGTVTAVLAIVLGGIALGIFLPPRGARVAVLLAAAVAAVIWVVGENFGGMSAGSATDPNSGPILMLLAAAYWPARRISAGVGQE